MNIKIKKFPAYSFIYSSAHFFTRLEEAQQTRVKEARELARAGVAIKALLGHIRQAHLAEVHHPPPIVSFGKTDSCFTHHFPKEETTWRGPYI
jgi:hypothetical protein